MNNFCFIGRIGRDAETRSTPQGKQVTSWSVAVDSGFGDRKTTIWVDCALWGDRGAKVAQYLTKGAQVGVSGELGLREYEKDGATKTSVTLNVANVSLIGGKSDAEPRQKAAPQRQAAPADDGFDDQDLPF